MGWFDEQIKQRIQDDEVTFQNAFAQMAGAVMGAKVSAALNDGSQATKNAMDEILKFYHIKPMELPDNLRDMNETLEYLMRPSGIMRRTVKLEKGWYKDAVGAMLGTRTDDGNVVALMPTGLSGYSFYDTASGKYQKLNKKTEILIADEAICFYKPFPLKKLGFGNLITFIVETLSIADFVFLALATLGATLLGLFIPKLNNLLFSTVIESGSVRLLLAIAAFFVSVSISVLLMDSVKALLMARIDTKISIGVQSATMMRVLSLPADFFKEYSAGELSSRSQYVDQLCTMITSSVLSTGLTSVFSLVYITQIFAYAPSLVIPALIIIGVTIVFSFLTALLQMKISKKQMEIAAKESGMSYALISGVQKIKLTGAEKRAFARWAAIYSKNAELTYNPPMFLKINPVIATAINLVGVIVMYFFAAQSRVDVAEYFAFNIAYGMVSGAFFSLTSIALTVAQIKPVYEMVRPILHTVPEIAVGKKVVTRLSGGIELNNISFRYNETMPLVIDNLSLKIRPGQYVAIVGQRAAASPP